MIFSVIIPAYNPDDKIFRLLEQLVTLKTKQNIEVIVIDDGSEYFDKAKMEKYILQDIVYRRFENGGVAAARNRGIKLAKGDYITFFDADDMIDIGNLNSVLEKISSSEKKADIYMSGYSLISENNRKDIIPALSPGTYGKEELEILKKCLIDVKFSKRYSSSYMGGKVYQYIVNRKLFFNYGLGFPEGQNFAEDLCYCMQMFHIAKNICVFKDIVYLYYAAEGSASHSYRPYLWEEWNGVSAFVNNYTEDSVLQNRLLYWAGKNAIRHYIINEKNYSRLKPMIMNILKSNKFQSAKSMLNYNNWTVNENIENALLKPKNLFWLIGFEKLLIGLKDIRGKKNGK